MDELTRTLAPLVDHPPLAPTDLDDIVRRATARRRVRWAVSGGAASIVVAVAAVAASSLAPVGTPSVEPVGPPPAVEADGDRAPTSSRATTTDEPVREDPVSGSETEHAEPHRDPTPVPSEGATAGPEFSGEDPEPHPDAAVRTWVRDEGRIAWQVENGRDGMWVAGFFRTADDVANATATEPDRFWTLVADEGEDAPREDLLRLALDALSARPPDGYETAVAGVDLRVTSAVLEGTWLAVDHPGGTVLTDNDYGSAGAAEFAYQYLAVVRHYYPEAETLCVSIDGVESRDDGPYILHDGIGCPWSLR